MTDRSTELARATAADGELLSNLVELYVHDLSAIFAHVELGANGRYGYADLPAYLAGSHERLAFLIRYDGRIAGFILAKRGSPFSSDPQALDIAEFFVLRRFRGLGVGREAAELLWRGLPGRWLVRVASKNADAVQFWRRVVTTYTHDGADETEHSTGSGSWFVFSFEAAQRA